MAEKTTARELGIRSRAAVHARDREGWLALFADDALVQDPIGPSLVRGVYTYRHDGRGKLAFLRSYWEFDALEVVELSRRG